MVSVAKQYGCLRVLMAKKKTGKNMPKNSKMLSKVFWGSLVTEICIFSGPTYLPHGATNTAAYKCISLFYNTFLPSGKAVLVFSELCGENPPAF